VNGDGLVGVLALRDRHMVEQFDVTGEAVDPIETDRDLILERDRRRQVVGAKHLEREPADVC
jgi:hypothetical protein